MPDPNATLSLHQAYQQFLSPINGWAPRDVVAHLIGWNILVLESSLSILAGNPPSYYDDAPNDYSNINASFTVKHSSQSKLELLAELQSSMEKLEMFIDSLPARNSQQIMELCITAEIPRRSSKSSLHLPVIIKLIPSKSKND